jgi:hypothetical protein
MLWASLECKGASPMNQLNWVINGPKTREKIKHHLSKFVRMFAVVRAAARIVRRFKGTIAFELLSTIFYWKTALLKECIHENALEVVNFHGCSFTLRVTHGPNPGMLAPKPWRVATNSRFLAKALEKQCTRDHEHHHSHGVNLSKSESYTPEMAATIHKAFKEHEEAIFDVSKRVVAEKAPITELQKYQNLSGEQKPLFIHTLPSATQQTFEGTRIRIEKEETFWVYMRPKSTALTN